MAAFDPFQTLAERLFPPVADSWNLITIAPMEGSRERFMRVAVGTVLSVLYWFVALFFLLFSQIGDPPRESQTPEGLNVVYATRHRTGLVILCVEVLIYAVLFILIRRAGKSRPR